ncbi:MAG: hypothetical protein II135_09895 [Clostridia bacterium]|nr:hypothetical protein [Clostridia bacterium]
MWLLILLNDEADKKRFESLLKLYGDMMYRIAFGILKSREDVEDAQSVTPILEDEYINVFAV